MLPLNSTPTDSANSLNNTFPRSDKPEINNEGSVSTVIRVTYSHEISSYKVSLNDTQGQNAITYAHLSQNYQYSSSTAHSPGLEDVEESQAIRDSEPLLDGARTILQFVEQRIAMEKAEGATEEELAELWEKGLEGFVQGYTEAYDMLEGMGQLSGNVLESVETLAAQVYAGFDEIYERYIGLSDGSGDESKKPKAASYGPELTPPAVENSNAPRQLFSRLPFNNNVASEQSSLKDQFAALNRDRYSALGSIVDSLDDLSATVEYGRKDSFAFELTTVDGDKVSIYASNTSVFYGQYSEIEEGEGASETNRFAFNVSGDIDEQEQAAIDHLLGQIMSLADEFYNGDIYKAYEAAMNLGYDKNEIASYSVNLRQVEQFSASVAYQTRQTDVPVEMKEAFSRIGEFAQKVLEALNDSNNYRFFDYTQLLKSISEQIDGQIKVTGTQSFREAIEHLVTVNQK